MCLFFFSSIRRHTRCALVTGVQTCALPIYWGLELLPGEPGFRIMRPSSSAMVRVGVHSPGKLRSRTSDCTISMNGLMADCAIGKGRALVLADADLLRDASWFGPEIGRAHV